MLRQPPAMGSGRPRTARELLRRARPAITAAVLLALAVNAVIAGAYLWSRDGQTTRTRVEVSGDSVRVFVDGRLHIESDAPISPGTNVLLRVEGVESIPSLPSPRGIDRVVVTSLSTGAVLFEDDFSDVPPRGARWSLAEGQLFVEDGVLGSKNGTLLVFDPGAEDGYAVDATYRNVTGGTIVVRAEHEGDTTSGIMYSFRPFRHLDNVLGLHEDGEVLEVVAGPKLELPREQTLKSILGIALEPYPLVLLLLATGLVGVAALQVVMPALDRLARWTEWMMGAAIALLVVATFATTAYLINAYGSGVPHVPDELSYLFQSKVLAGGRLSAPVPEVLEPFEIGSPPLVAVTDGRWASVYPFGHPAMLAIGERFGAVSYVPPAVGTACVLLVFLLGRRLYGARVGLLAALLLAASPFFLMSASNFMSHNTTAFYLLMSLALLASADGRPLAMAGRRPYVMTALAGVFLGLVFATRPLTGVALVPPFAAFLALPLLYADQRVDTVKRGLVFALAGFAVLLLYFAYKYGTAGDPFAVDPIQGGPDVLGFSGQHTVDRGMSQQQTQMAHLALVLHHWPIATGLVFAFLPFILGTRHRWDWFLLACAVIMMSVYAAYFIDGLMYGPRFWYEAAPLLILLAARGGDRAAQLFAGAARRLAIAPSRPAVAAEHAGVLIVYVFMASMAVFAAHDWLRGDGGEWFSDAVPRHARELEGFNGVNDRLVREVRDADLENALVLVEDCPQWWCYGSVFWMNSPWLDGDVVLARYLPERVPDLIEAFPGRSLHRAEYSEPPVLEPYDPDAEPPPDEEPEDEGTTEGD